MSQKRNVLIFGVLCIFGGARTQGSHFGHRPPHIHGPMFPPHVIGRPPHSHEDPVPVPAEVEYRPPHSHEWPFEYNFHDESPMLPTDAESTLVSSDAVEPRVLSDAEDKTPHFSDESQLGPFNPEGRPPHIDDHSPLGPPDAERRPPHIHRPMFPPHFIGRPPHSHEEPSPIPAEAEDRPSHIHDEAPPMLSTDAELQLVPSDAAELRVLSDAEDRPPHDIDESKLGPFNPEGRPPHIHDHLPLRPSDAVGRPPHIHRPMLPPHFIGRPPHSHEDPAPIPAEAEYRPPHFHDEALPMLPTDAESQLVPSDAVEPRVLSDSEDRPPHNNDESKLGPSDADGKSPHIHRPVLPPHFIGRPPHSHEDPAPVPAEAEYRPPHFHDEGPPPFPHDWPFEYNFHDEAPMYPSDAESTLVSSDAVEPRVLSDAEGRPPHIDDQSPLGPFNPEGKLAHIHDNPHVPYDKPFQHLIPDWGHIGYWVQWTPCDIDDGPRVRCQDCRTKLICTRLGGFVFENHDGSYCNDGLWSDVPREECV